MRLWRVGQGAGVWRLQAALTENNVPHEYIVFPHSGHGLQNDNRLYGSYMDKVEEYLEIYMPIDRK